MGTFASHFYFYLNIFTFFIEVYWFLDTDMIVMYLFNSSNELEMMADEKFNLKWRDFQANASNTFAQLRREEDFFDVTLVSSDKNQVQAHKVIISACSDYFKSILKLNKQGNHILCLDNVTSKELTCVVDYIYNGEVNVEEKHLERFLDIAQRFELQGLITNDDEEYEKESKQKPNEPEVFTLDVNEYDTEKTNGYDDSKSSLPLKSLLNFSSDQFSNVEDLDKKIRENLTKFPGKGYECILCQKLTKDFRDAREHVETHFEGLSFPCQFCDKTLRSRHALRKHSIKCKISFFQDQKFTDETS